MTVAVEIQVPKNAQYKVRVRMERRDTYDPRSWNLSAALEFYPGDVKTLGVSNDVRIVRIEEVPLDGVKVSPPHGHKSITINEDAHGG